jgi:hypothetical protein
MTRNHKNKIKTRMKKKRRTKRKTNIVCVLNKCETSSRGDANYLSVGVARRSGIWSAWPSTTQSQWLAKPTSSNSRKRYPRVPTSASVIFVAKRYQSISKRRMALI